MPIIWTPDPTFDRNNPVLRGAIPSPKSRLLSAEPFVPLAAPPSEVAYVPKRLSYWGNNRYGICVSSQEAFCKGCDVPNNPAGVFITEEECIRWARSHGWLNGASLTGVMDDMAEKGFVQNSQAYNDGPYKGVDYSNQTVLRAAIAVGPVNIAIPANALPSGAGSRQGWYILGDREYRGSDHCVALSGYGSAEYLFKQLEVTRPAALPGDTQGYLLFTWSTIGFVDHAWVAAAVDEAWVRNPTTLGVPPLPIPTPNPPGPPPGPAPSIIEIEVKQPIPAGKYLLFRNEPV